MDASPFHEGELEAQVRAGESSRGAGIREFMPDQHRDFFALLPYLFAAGRDARGKPIATILTGPEGFVSSPAPDALAIAALPGPDDPANAALSAGAPIGLLGLDLRTRRRNRANGIISERDGSGLKVAVSQSFGNCAKYIQVRQHEFAPTSAPTTEELGGLDAAASALIAQSDTLFIASGSDSGLDVSHRGGRPGFVRIEGGRLTVPDFAGNSYFNTFGNLLREPATSLLFIDFAKGDVLQLQGMAEIVWDGPELAGLDGAKRLMHVEMTRAWRRKAALPLRWTEPELAPTTLATGTWRHYEAA
ncbi:MULTISPECIES: pyridoxamine 5'-phosphate oxidase family protein [unclassified Bosea (in: a-proteobacteria)]|uniref:pyridoxamine 5'-phosphate oxidase family protein n=1 Tax=unclassified Bosea (in: a-proteobacteria) TaxID=2653178 RepID=UPI000F74D74A|nr:MULTISPECIES: pyridoxamine 5'-phosphate oxidase family protein [unclassified Bosea (in: a-proteobacteria)]AZO76241.1 pyridoxamine 5'-phosphate oxidase [Bosea sp. Tri-49]RXT26168.1 pyridoxamine 5'-phosphate oxidase [Bosea sp. Tri-39]RXT31410.1 pyridoxamine 5'-phosphate oxidase [Bosea sp. Tri-54]